MVLAACGGDDEGGGAGDESGGDVTLAAGPQLHRGPAAAPLRRAGHRRRGREGGRRHDDRDLLRPASSAPTPTGSPRWSPATSTWTSRAPPRWARSTSRCRVLDAAYAFDDSDHLARYFDSDAVRRAAPGLRGRDRRAHARRVVGRHARVHRQRADPRARRPRRPADALPQLPAVPHERQGAGRRRDRGGLRGAVPRPPAGHRRRPGEPDHQHRGQQPRRTCRTTSACPTTRRTPTW